MGKSIIIADATTGSIKSSHKGDLIATFKTFTRNGKIYVADEETGEEVNVLNYTVQGNSMVWRDQEGQNMLWQRLMHH